MRRTSLAICFLATSTCRLHAADDVTTIQITDKVLVEDTLRLGINTCSDNYWDSSILKMRIEENFEGTMYRSCNWGPEQDEDGIAVWFRPSDDFEKVLIGAPFTMLCGPAKGQSGTITKVGLKKIKDGREITYLLFDRPLPASPLNENGIMVEIDRTSDGRMNRTQTDYPLRHSSEDT